MSKGLLILGHGSKVASANQELCDIAEMVRKTGDYSVVEVAFLQLCEPLLPEGIKASIKKGAKSIIIVPYFLFKGTHVQKDIPCEIEKIKGEFPDIEISLAKHIGPDMSMAKMILRRANGCVEAFA